MKKNKQVAMNHGIHRTKLRIESPIPEFSRPTRESVRGVGGFARIRGFWNQFSESS